ncbi:STAS domain-containing protein [Catellatospora sp. NPDC049609]|uniref:STAS domain-containing protein n=1 Tax=Catellatospora sp. NPDC049609 TaxID=3155505 RepID=UPI00341517B5
MSEPLELRLYAAPSGLYLTVRGWLDATTAHLLGKAIAVALERFEADQLTVDLADVEAIDVAGIATLTMFQAAALRHGVTLCIARPPAAVRAAIHAAGADVLLAVAPADEWEPPIDDERPRRFTDARRSCLRPRTPAGRGRRHPC